MATLRSRNRRNISDSGPSSPSVEALNMDSPSSDIEIYAKEVLGSLLVLFVPTTIIVALKLVFEMAKD